MLQVRQIVNCIFTSNTYVVFDDEYDYCWLIDIGDYQKVAEVLPDGVKVKGVFLTHTHFDHIYGINALYKAYSQCMVFTAEYGIVSLYDEKKNFSKYHESPFIFEGTDIIILKDKESVQIYPDLFMIAYQTPGHCPSCLTYILNNWVFTGDAYIPGINVVTKLPRGNKIQAKDSVELIKRLAEGKIICPGHGPISDD